jgi:predicted amidophosphoribosyltransferase
MIRACARGISISLSRSRFIPRDYVNAASIRPSFSQKSWRKKINVPLNGALERIRYTTTQTAFDRVERMENLRGAFRLRKKIGVRGLHVLLVDDILTTGSTLSECARVLREAGARSVYAVTAARA